MTRVTGGGEAVASRGEDELETIRGLRLIHRDRKGLRWWPGTQRWSLDGLPYDLDLLRRKSRR